MGTVEYRRINSTTGRANKRLDRAPRIRLGAAAGCRRYCRQLLAVVLDHYHDPLGIEAELKSLTLDETEILTDLDHGRD